MSQKVAQKKERCPDAEMQKKAEQKKTSQIADNPRKSELKKSSPAAGLRKMRESAHKKRMPVERGVPKGPPRQQVPQSVQECAVKKDPWFQIGTANRMLHCDKMLHKKGSRGTVGHLPTYHRGFFVVFAQKPGRYQKYAHLWARGIL